jgi:hypothetical protein
LLTYGKKECPRGKFIYSNLLKSKPPTPHPNNKAATVKELKKQKTPNFGPLKRKKALETIRRNAIIRPRGSTQISKHMDAQYL